MKFFLLRKTSIWNILICNNISMLYLPFLPDILEGPEVLFLVCVQWHSIVTGHVLKEPRASLVCGSEVCHLKEWVFWQAVCLMLVNHECDRLSICWKIRHQFLKSSNHRMVWIRKDLQVPTSPSVFRDIFH